ncbi:MAG: acetylglutamate kinase [Gemmatimonadaceae bacterium]
MSNALRGDTLRTNASRDREITVVKLGGRTQADPALSVAIKALWERTNGRLVIVHGGGDQISTLQRLRGEEPVFVGGRRFTSPIVLELVRMVLSGSANKSLVSALTAVGVPAVGISGEDAALLPATILDAAVLGFAGTPGKMQPALVHHLLAGSFLPVISPVGTNMADSAHSALNINGDDAAAAIAVALGAEELLLMVDVAGVLNSEQQLLPQLTLAETHQLVESGVAGGGMAAKLEACEIALAGGVSRVRIGNITALTVPSAGTVITADNTANTKSPAFLS